MACSAEQFETDGTLELASGAGQSAFDHQPAGVHQWCQSGCRVSTEVTYPLASDVVDADGIVIVRIARFASNHDVLAHSSGALVVADAGDGENEGRQESVRQSWADQVSRGRSTYERTCQ